jgi:hypothetical protein
MKKITVLEPIDFMNYCLNFGEVDTEYANNYSHTHDQVNYNPETGLLSLEEVCINEYGGKYGRNVYKSVIIPKEWQQFLPTELTLSPFWGLF